MNKPLSIAELAALAAAQQDQTETVTAVEFTPPPEGDTIGRLVEYIELGKIKPKPQKGGKEQPPALNVRITFELLHPKKNIHEYEDDNGNTMKRADRVSMQFPIKLSERATFKKMFNKMTYGRDNIKHMAQMLNDPFRLTIWHGKSADGKTTYVNFVKRDSEGNITDIGIGAPVAHVLVDPNDSLSGTKPVVINVPEAISPLKLFLWNNPTKETWDSLFIDGTREVKDDKGNVKQVSKNWVQELILSAADYTGSALEQMLNGLGDLSIEPEKKAEPKEQAKPAAGVTDGEDLPWEEPKAPVETKAAPAASAASAADDALAALGLV